MCFRIHHRRQRGGSEIGVFRGEIVLGLFDAEQGMPILDVFRVLHQNLEDLAVEIRFDLVHQLHGFDDAQDLAFAHGWPTSTKGGASGAGAR